MRRGRRGRVQVGPQLCLLAPCLAARNGTGKRADHGPKIKCFDGRWAQTLCCADSWPPTLNHLLDGCFTHGRTRELCCGKPASVLIYSYPKVASRYLIDCFKNMGYKQKRGGRVAQTHIHIMAEYEFKRMRPPCLVATVARNFFSRNPSHFFYTSVLDEWDLEQMKLTYGSVIRRRDGRLEVPDNMYVGRWLTRQDFHRSDAHLIRQTFLRANVEVSQGYLKDYFGILGTIVGVDMIKLAQQHPERPYVFANSSELGCKCDVLLLTYESVGTWPAVMRELRLLHRMRVLSDHAGANSWYGPHYRGFMAELEYTELEAAAMCNTDTMKRLPFYAGRCGRCEGGLCREVLPGLRKVPSGDRSRSGRNHSWR